MKIQSSIMKKGLNLLFLFFCFPFSMWSLDLNSLRLNWYNELTGYPYDSEITEIETKIVSLTSTGQKQWDAMKKEADRSQLWSDLSYSTSADITESYSRLESMALAYGGYSIKSQVR